jgi:hypothetical protein
VSNTPNQPALWQVLHKAHIEESGMVQYSNSSQPVLGEPDRFTWAAMIRALRDWLVPEGLLTADEMDIRDQLTAEADRAESGDD